jgi:hypothetical protein
MALRSAYLLGLVKGRARLWRQRTARVRTVRGWGFVAALPLFPVRFLGPAVLLKVAQVARD